MDTNLKRYFTEMENILDNHLAALDAGSPKNGSFELDISTMLFERKRVFENLRNAVSITPHPVRKQLQGEADRILEKDAGLQQALEERKQELLKILHHSAQGKRVLKGYGGSNRSSSRFMSSIG